jgi:purine-binding chemotaxis protein CheW
VVAQDILLFELDGHRCAVPAACVDQVINAVTIHPLPGAPEIVSGVINVRGRIVPVVDLRKRLGLPSRPLRASDHLVLVRLDDQRLAFVVDRALGLESAAVGEVQSGIAPSPSSGVAKLAEGLALLCDPGSILTGQEVGALGTALSIK